MANERPMGLRNDDKKIAENWNKIDWSKAGDEFEVKEVPLDEEGLEVLNLTEKEFNDLPEYSSTIPTGVRIGKKWKRGEPFGESKPTKWFLGEYTQCPKEEKMAITTWKRITVSESADKALRLDSNKSKLPLTYLITSINGRVSVPSEIFAEMIEDFWGYAKCKTPDDYILKFWSEFFPESNAEGANWLNCLHKNELTNFSYFIYGFTTALGYIHETN